MTCHSHQLPSHPAFVTSLGLTTMLGGGPSNPKNKRIQNALSVDCSSILFQRSQSPLLYPGYLPGVWCKGTDLSLFCDVRGTDQDESKDLVTLKCLCSIVDIFALPHLLED